MECPNCNTTFSDINQKYCEFCGIELRKETRIKEKLKKRDKNSYISRRHCC